MEVEIEDIVNSDSFEAWLSDQSDDVARVLSMRIALRVLPNVLSIFSVKTPKLTEDIAQNLTIHSFRAKFISWAARKYPAHDMNLALSAAYSAVYSVARSSADSVAGSAAVSTALSTADSAILAAAISTYSIAHSVRSALSTYSVADSAALSAAHSAAGSAADSAALSAVWEVIRADASTTLKNGALAVFTSSLWPENAGQSTNQILSDTAQEQISNFKQTKECTVLPWGLWIAWWESLQNDTSHSLFGEKADLEIALKGDEFWDRDAAVVMGELAEIVGWPWGEERTSEIPPQQAAPIEAEFQDDKIVRQYSSHLQPTQGIPQIHALLLREAISMRDWISPQMAGAGALFDELIAELGSSLEATNIYGVGFWETSLQQFSQRVDEQFLEDNAARFAGLMINLDRFLKQSVDWQEYIKNVHAAELGGLDPEKANTAVSEIVEAISIEEIVDESISQPLTQLKQALLGAQTFNPETTYGFYRSLANVIQVVASVSISAGKEPVKKFAVDVGHELRKKSVAWTATGILTMVSGAFLYLTGALPTMFGFLKPILAALKKG